MLSRRVRRSVAPRGKTLLVDSGENGMGRRRCAGGFSNNVQLTNVSGRLGEEDVTCEKRPARNVIVMRIERGQVSFTDYTTVGSVAAVDSEMRVQK